MELADIRRVNLRRLMDAEYGVGKRGAQRKFAERVGKQPDYISRCLAEPDKGGAKNIGEDFAREIEAAFSLIRHSFDSPNFDPRQEQLEAVSVAAVERQNTLNDLSPATYRAGEIDRDLLATLIADADTTIKRRQLHITAHAKANAIAGTYKLAIERGETADTYNHDLLVGALEAVKDRTHEQ